MTTHFVLDVSSLFTVCKRTAENTHKQNAIAYNDVTQCCNTVFSTKFVYVDKQIMMFICICNACDFFSFVFTIFFIFDLPEYLSYEIYVTFISCTSFEQHLNLNQKKNGRSI